MNLALRPLSTAEILDRTFSLYRNNFLLFAGIAILPGLIALSLQVVGLTAHLTVRTPGRSLAQTQMMSLAYGALVFFVASIIGGAIATGATVYAVYYLHLGKTATISESYKDVLASWFRVIAAAGLAFALIVLVCLVLAIGLAFAFFWPASRTGSDPAPWIAGLGVFSIAVVVFVCWLYLSGWLSFVIPALLLEKITIFRSFRRSHRLSRGSRGRIFLVLLLTLILTLIFTWTMYVPAYMIFDQRRQEIPFHLWTYVAQFISTVLAGPIATIAIALIYIDQRIRKEAFDLHLMMQSIEESDHMAFPGTPSIVT